MEVAQTQRPVGTDEKSRAISKAAAALIPMGAHGEDDPWPAGGTAAWVMAKGRGATLSDVDGNEYIDYDCAHGALILGHADERVVVAVNKAISKGCTTCALSETQVRLAELVASRYASIDMVQFVNSKAEAIRGAVQLVRAHAGREGILQFEGCESGYVFGDAFVAPYNDLKAAKRILSQHRRAVAAVLVQPEVTGFGVVLPADGFLQGLRHLCDDHGALLIFDESIVGFRAAPGAETDVAGAESDLTVLGPLLGGGLPLAAYGGRKDIMTKAPQDTDGPGHTAGGFSSPNTVSMAAGVATLQAIGESGFYDELEAKSVRLEEGLRAAAQAASVPAVFARKGSILGTFFSGETAVDLKSARACDMVFSARYFRAMLSQGIFLPSSPWPVMFVSAAHTNEQVDRTIEAAQSALQVAAGCDDDGRPHSK